MLVAPSVCAIFVIGCPIVTFFVMELSFRTATPVFVAPFLLVCSLHVVDASAAAQSMRKR